MPHSPTNAAQGDDLQRLQRRRKHTLRAGAALSILLLLVTDSSWRTGAPHIHTLLQRCGFVLVLLCIFGRTWSTLYIGGHKKRDLITKGPYSMVRNPLYVFTIIGVAGVGLMAGSMVVAALFAAFALTVFSVVTRQEEAFLAAAFGETFAAYAGKVPRFWPRLSAWRDADEVIVKPSLVLRTFFDASLFLLAVPLMEIKELLQRLGWLPVLFNLP